MAGAGSARERLLRELGAWRPERGVISVVVDADPADRGGAWRIALREQLQALSEQASRDDRTAVCAAVERIRERLNQDAPPPGGRTQFGYVEVAERPREVWQAAQVALGSIEASRGPGPRLRPLVEAFEIAPEVGVALPSLEQVRLLEWSLGVLHELDRWEITLWSKDWRERKAERSPAGPGSRTSASGRDQYEQRLDHNRERFLHEVGARIARRQRERGWRELLAFGAEPATRALARGAGNGAKIHALPGELLNAGADDICAHVRAALEQLTRERDERLVEAIENAIAAEPGVALGPAEARDALREGRVRHLVLASGDDDPARAADPVGRRRSEPVAEELIAAAITTGAEVTPVRGRAAAVLAPHDGVAALLRY